MSTTRTLTSWSRWGKQLTRAALGFAAFALASSVSARPGLPALRSEPLPAPTQVVLVALDGVRFQDVFEGVDAELARRFGVPAERVVARASLMPHLRRALEERARASVRTALLVTTDHGRSHGFRDHGRPHPESARVWLVAAGSAIRARGSVASPAPRRLADVAPTLRELLHLPRDTSLSAGQPLTELLLSP